MVPSRGKQLYTAPTVNIPGSFVVSFREKLSPNSRALVQTNNYL